MSREDTFIKIVKFLVFLEGSDNITWGSLHFINSKALLQKKKKPFDVTNHWKSLIQVYVFLLIA